MKKIIVKFILWLMLYALTIVLVNLTFTEWHRITNEIVENKKYIEFQWGFGLYLLILIVPLTNILMLLSYKPKIKYYFSQFYLAFYLGMVFLGFYINISVGYKLDWAGYTYCEPLSTHMTKSTFKVYVNEPSLCVD